MSAPTCTIVIHPPAAPTPASPMLGYTTLGALCESIEDTRSPQLFGLSSLLSALQAKITIPAEQFLRPPEMKLPGRRRKMRVVKPRVNPPRGRRLPDPWRVVSDSTGRLVLVPIQNPEEVAASPAAPAAPSISPAGSQTSPKPVDNPGPFKGRLTGLDDPRLVPWFESAVYLVMLILYMQSTVMTLF
ncbi:hypothetical protein BV20DRAFT_982041 [Pilatotrama ljubarskyi]|nr:hypothetical protein BV20DRAFT_982041 [Pilatotrama ljubarskyi]